ncbi:MAG: prepilin-type N-terminal cleavage/methylation domain-containing protein [Gemmatimonadaceae bacterium]|nr:prepilin-type N-terminal cleavage/methylation domain-containing protein [Gemmatimonadaceae bacterium]
MRSKATARGCRRAFTLIEIIVAMSISAMLLVGARAMLGEVGDDALRIGAEAVLRDHDANSERYFRALVGRVELGGGSEHEFAGEPLRATFSSWCDTPGGWQERCRVVMSVERRNNRIAVVARPTIGPAVVLRDSAQRGALRYLITAEGGGSWLQIWGAGITAPLAIGVIVDADTLIIPIGDRG